MDTRNIFGHSASLLRQAELWVDDLLPAIYNYLILDESTPDHPLFRLHPTNHQKEALSTLVASLHHNILGCRLQRIRELSQAWQLEEYLLGRIVRCGSSTRQALLHRLLLLHPSPGCSTRLSALPRTDPEVAFWLLLVDLYAMPSQVVELLKRHPHPLSLPHIERVVEVLHLRSPKLTPPRIDGHTGDNVDIFLLYIAWAEGVGSAIEQARRLTLSPNRTIRTAAFNILLGEAMMATL